MAKSSSIKPSPVRSKIVGKLTPVRVTELTLRPLEEDWIVSHLPTDQIGRTTSLAIEVFGDEDVTVAWLREPNLATDNKAPIAMLGTTEGYERVRNLLLRIEYGVLA